MATLAQFRVQFPEFGAGVSDALITQYLSAAAIEISTVSWGPFGTVGNPMTKADQGQLYLAAHKLAMSPFGQNAKLQIPRKEGYQRTSYGAEFELIQRGVVSGFRVA